jgi:uncharacterized protein (DUF302 family)
MNRLEAELARKGMTVLARIDHAAAADAVGLALQPTEALIFGNPHGGTPLMQASQTIGLDLPLRVLVWQDAGRDTWLTYNDPRWLARRHGVHRAGAAEVAAMTAMLACLVAATTALPGTTPR